MDVSRHKRSCSHSTSLGFKPTRLIRRGMKVAWRTTSWVILGVTVPMLPSWGLFR